MTYKLLIHKIILVFRVARIYGSSLSDKLLFNTIMSIGLSPNYFGEREKTFYLFYNKARNYVNSLSIKNIVKQLLNCRPKSHINYSNIEAVHRN